MKELVFNNIEDCELAHIFECGQCFRWNLEDIGSKLTYVGVVGSYVAAAELSDGVMTLKVTGGEEKFWSNYFDLGTNYGDIKCQLNRAECSAMSMNGPSLCECIESGNGIRILNQDLFETIISFIISQNNNIPRIKKCIESICEHYGEPLGEIFGKERFAFPTPAALAKAEPSALAALRLGYRCEYIPRAACQFIEEGAPTSYEQILSYLGVGPKVANCILLFGLHKFDSFPIDTWVKHFMHDLYGFNENDKNGMAQFAQENWDEYAGLAQQYLFYGHRK